MIDMPGGKWGAALRPPLATKQAGCGSWLGRLIALLNSTPSPAFGGTMGWGRSVACARPLPNSPLREEGTEMQRINSNNTESRRILETARDYRAAAERQVRSLEIAVRIG